MRGNGVIQHRALQGELATPEHPQATNNGACSRDAPGPTDQLGASAGLHTRHRRAAPVRAQRGTQPRPPKAPCAATKVKTARARTSPHLQWCDRGVDGPGAGDDGPPASAGLHTRHRRAAPVRDLSTEAQAPARDNHRGQGMGHLQVCTHVIGVPRPSAHNAARSPDPPKLLARPPQSKPRGLGRRLTCNGATVG